MPRALRLQLENGIYHVYNRGNAKQVIFRDDRDRLRFLRALREARDLCGWSVLSYCLMPNHYHAVLCTPEPNLAHGMHHLGHSYTQAFNRRHERPGHLFQGRYGSRLIQTDEYLLATLGYIAKNPVTAGLCRRPEDWRWSGHRAIVNRARSRIVDVPATLTLLAADDEAALAMYRQAVERATAEAPSAKRRQNSRPELPDLLARGAEGLLEAYFTHGYTQQEIAARIGCHMTTVGRRVRAARREMHFRGADPF